MDNLLLLTFLNSVKKLKAYVKLLWKQLLIINEFKTCYSFSYCALQATSKFNFEPLLDFIKNLKENDLSRLVWNKFNVKSTDYKDELNIFDKI